MPELRNQDYEEPRCPFDASQWKKEVTRIPERRVLEKLDEYLAKNDYRAAEAHLKYWTGEAELGNDEQGLFTLENEYMGLCRKLGRGEDAVSHAETALSLMEKLSLGDTVSGGTALVNAATVYKAFGRAADAVPLYRRAREVYEALLPEDDQRLGGLYNNFALALAELGRFDEAYDLNNLALAVMRRIPGSEPEQAITWLNIADALCAEAGREAAASEIGSYLEEAKALLDAPHLPHNGNYAFVCEKCAPTFGHYGDVSYMEDLMKRAETIYKSNRAAGGKDVQLEGT